MKAGLCGIFLLLNVLAVSAQRIITGSVLDEAGKPIQSASVQLLSFSDSTKKFTTATDKDGFFALQDLSFDFYRLRVSYAGLLTLSIDSIHIRQERSDFNLGDLVLKQKTAEKMEEVVIFLEKPLIETKDGNITFNASESALSAGSNASDLLANAPLVTKDPNGKVLVRGKEPKILIDDKPVNLNLQQMQDLLESIPGSSIEKIEVMTNPPAQYANEEGGVINIVTKKGTVGMNGRVNAFTGTRGEAGANANFNYRKTGIVLNAHVGFIRNNFNGFGFSIRENIFKDSVNHLNTNSSYRNMNVRPNGRVNFDYELNKFHSFNLVLQYNSNDYDNLNNTTFRNMNRFDETYRLSNRNINSSGINENRNLGLTYTLKTKKPGQTLRLNANFNSGENNNNRLFYQQFFNPDHTYNGLDSIQTQFTINNSSGYNIQLNYDFPLSNKNTFLNLGSSLNHAKSDIRTDAAYKRKSDGEMVALEMLSNHFLFSQDVQNFRTSLKQVFSPRSSFTAGISAEATRIHFDFWKQGLDTSNNYWTFLPFANFNKSWSEIWTFNLKYRRSIRRPGINELNPTVDFSDPYNTRFGNPGLEASTVHNFDAVFGRNKSGFYTNVGLGYNIVEDVFSQIRTLQTDGKTEITWENISGRKEYELSTWSGYTINKKLRLNMSASYTYNQYNDYDRTVRKFRNGGSLSSSLNTNYTIKDLYTATGNFTLNRFANPQGSVRSTISMNLGIQGRFLNKKMTVTLNAIDPFTQQENRTFTYGRNFILENFNSTQTRNYRLTVGYNISKSTSKVKSPFRKVNAPKKVS